MQKNNKTLRIVDFSGWLNTLDDPTNIQDKQGTVFENFQVEGNKLITPNGYILLKNFSATVKPIQGIKLYDNTLVVLHNWTLYVHNISSGTTKSLAAACTVGLDYNIAVYMDKIVITNYTEVPKAFTYDTTFTVVPSTQAFTGLTANFTATSSIFYQGRLFLAQYYAGATPKVFSNVMLFSKSISTNADLAPMFDFSALDSSSQAIWGGAPITGFAIGQNNMYVVKNNAFFKLWEVIVSKNTSDVIIWVAFPSDQVTQTGAVNQECVVNVDQDIFYFDGQNYRRLSYEQNILALKDSSISDEVSLEIRALPLDQSKATCFYVYPYFKGYLRSEFSSDNDVGFVYNVIKKSWSRENGKVMRHSTSGYDSASSKQVAFFGSVYDGSVCSDDKTLAFNGASRTGEWISKEYDFGDEIDMKRLTQCELAWSITPWFSVNFQILTSDWKIVDERTITETTLETSTTGTVTAGSALAGAGWEPWLTKVWFRERYEEFYDSSSFRFRFTYEGTGYFELTSLNLMFRFVKAYPMHH